MTQKQFDQAQGAMRLIYPGGDVVWFFVVAPSQSDPTAPTPINWAHNAADRKKFAAVLHTIADQVAESA